MTPSIKSYYAHALAEGEGVGTAYEYYAKRRVLRPLLAAVREGDEVLVAGLPERYGTSLDFVVAAHDHGARARVIDDRPEVLERAERALAALQSAGELASVRVRYELVPSLADLARVSNGARAALVLSCEVLQRLTGAPRDAYVRALREAAPRGAVFVPNAENDAHLRISGLGGFDRTSLAAALGVPRAAFVDMPPFPPGITRTAAQRAKAETGAAEAIAMRLLEVYARAERFAPPPLQRRIAHIVYAAWP